MDPLPTSPDATDPLTELGKPLSLWLDGPELTPPRPALAEDVRAEVCIVGGGITGLTTALLLAREGRSVVLIEREHLGSGSSGANTGKVSSQHGSIYAPITKRYGVEAARTYGRANEEAKELIAELVAEGDGIACDFRRRDSYLYAADEGQRSDLEQEARAAKDAGLPAELTDEVPLPFTTRGALRFTDQAEFHPQRYLLGLAEKLEAAGGRIFEHTVAESVSVTGTPTIETSGGRVEADHLVIATLMPFLDRGGFFARAHPKRSYVISARAGRKLPEAMLLSIGSPTRSIRSQPAPDGSGELLLVGGEGHHVGSSDAEPARYARLAEFARLHWGAESIEHRWSAQDFEPVDQVTYIGPLHPLSKRIWIGTGFNKWGLTGGTVAARLISDGIQSRDNADAALFSTSRASLRGQAPKLVTENLKVGLHFVGDRLLDRGGRPIDSLAPGEGGIVSGPSGKVAGYRDPGGVLHAVSPNCTHLGCQLNFNSADVSWDCPCHGSRFGVDGELLDGPATEPLASEPTGAL